MDCCLCPSLTALEFSCSTKIMAGDFSPKGPEKEATRGILFVDGGTHKHVSRALR